MYWLLLCDILFCVYCVAVYALVVVCEALLILVVCVVCVVCVVAVVLLCRVSGSAGLVVVLGWEKNIPEGGCWLACGVCRSPNSAAVKCIFIKRKLRLD